MKPTSSSTRRMSSVASLLLAVAIPATVRGQAGWGWEAGCIGQWLQCGGLNYWGPTNCCDGHQCEYVNDYWWQCNPVAVPVDAPVTVAPTVAPAVPAAPAPAPAGTPKPHQQWTRPTPPPPGTPTDAPTPFPTLEQGPPFWEADPCFRMRRNILSLSVDELNTFIEALQTLKANGIYDNITAIHGNTATFNLFHGNDYFLPWHRWYVYHIETQIRNLGGKFACFAMPYWDWTLDAGKEASSPVFNIFGPMGNKNESFCMRTGPWATWLNNKGGCLKRIGSDSYRFFSPAEILDLIMTKDKYVNSFRPAFEAGAHSRPHLFIGGAMNTFASPDDPLFWLHHSYVDKVFTMWQDCHHVYDENNVAPEMFKPELLDVDLAYAPGFTTRKVWSIKSLGYAYTTDLMSASTFNGICKWTHIKYDPAISTIPVPGSPEDPNYVPPPLPVPAPAPPAKDASNGNLRGKATPIVPEPIPVIPPSNVANAPSGEGAGPATAETAAKAAALAPFQPHGSGLLTEENRIYSLCLARTKAAGESSADCLKEVLARDCEMLGFICDLPAHYRDGMGLAQSEQIMKESNSCAKACEQQP